MALWVKQRFEKQEAFCLTSLLTSLMVISHEVGSLRVSKKSDGGGCTEENAEREQTSRDVIFSTDKKNNNLVGVSYFTHENTSYFTAALQ